MALYFSITGKRNAEFLCAFWLLEKIILIVHRLTVLICICDFSVGKRLKVAKFVDRAMDGAVDAPDRTRSLVVGGDVERIVEGDFALLARLRDRNAPTRQPETIVGTFSTPFAQTPIFVIIPPTTRAFNTGFPKIVRFQKSRT